MARDKIINFRGVTIYRIQNGKMIETWHVIDGLPERTEIKSYNKGVS